MEARANLTAPGETACVGQYLIFSLGGEALGIGILQVKEIIEFGELTEVPMMPEAVRGVINLRGAVVPVIDLLARFGRGRTLAQRRTCVVIVELADEEQTHEVGIMVDSVSEVIEIAAADVEPAPTFGARIRTDFIAGMAKVAGRFVIVLEIGRVLSLDEIAQVGVSAARATSGPLALPA